jgi:DNA-directed RNA polymerase specialized sigma24 family protein
MQDQLCESDGSPEVPAVKRATAKPRKQGNPEKLEADRALYERLQRSDFTGWEMDLLREDLWLYGWKCLRAWMKDGTIIAKCGERGIVVPARWPEVETLTRRGDLRDEVAHDSVERAVRTFTEEYLPSGRWDPGKGATMRTYFIRTCMYAFRDAFKDWSYSYRRNLFASAEPLVGAELYAPYGSYEDTTVFQETIQRILENAGPEARAICGYIWETKTSQKEIGDGLGMTSRAVEGHMRRLRARAKLLVAKGEIEALYGRISTPKAGAR